MKRVARVQHVKTVQPSNKIMLDRLDRMNQLDKSNAIHPAACQLPPTHYFSQGLAIAKYTFMIPNASAGVTDPSQGVFGPVEQKSA